MRRVFPLLPVCVDPMIVLGVPNKKEESMSVLSLNEGCPVMEYPNWDD